MTCEEAVDTRYCATHGVAFSDDHPRPKAARISEFDLDDDEPEPERWANDMRVKRGQVR